MDLRSIVASSQPRLPWRRILLASLGVALVMAVLALIGDANGVLALVVGFAPSCLLVFALPEAPVSQPIAVIGGQLVSALIGVIAALLLPVGWWSVALVAGAAVAAMMLLRIIHPPAAASAVIAFTTGAGWTFLLLPVLVASVTIVATGLLWHRITGGRYPVTTRLR